MHRLLLDQGLARTAAAILRERGLDAVHVGELGLAHAADQVILERARGENRVVCTLDADFHELLAAGGWASPSVVRIRLEGLPAREIAALILRILQEVGPSIRQGVAVSVTAGAIRVRRLPLGKAT
jgi:predicted nuclease of predicted toxin-antitoxin system